MLLALLLSCDLPPPLHEDDCHDGVDADQDGLMDCEDVDCLSQCGEIACADGIDDDEDGAIDCLDDDCYATGPCWARATRLSANLSLTRNASWIAASCDEGRFPDRIDVDLAAHLSYVQTSTVVHLADVYGTVTGPGFPACAFAVSDVTFTQHRISGEVWSDPARRTGFRFPAPCWWMAGSGFLARELPITIADGEALIGPVADPAYRVEVEVLRSEVMLGDVLATQLDPAVISPSWCLVAPVEQRVYWGGR